MPTIHCPQCHTQLEIVSVQPGAIVRCPSCGASFALQPGDTADDVIDVHAEPVGQAPTVPAPPEREQVPPFGGEAPPGWYTFQFERRYGGGPPCCGIGCLLMAIFVLLALRGCLTLF